MNARGLAHLACPASQQSLWNAIYSTRMGLHERKKYIIT